MQKSRILSVIALILTLALPQTAAAQNAFAGVEPGCFKGAFKGQDAHDVLAPGATSVNIRTTAEGTGSVLGQFALTRNVTGDLIDFSSSGSARWTAANGDTLLTDVNGYAEPDFATGYLKVTEVHTVTNGTGRFARARGSFVVILYHNFVPSSVSGGVQYHDIFGTFQGTVSSPGSAPQ